MLLLIVPLVLIALGFVLWALLSLGARADEVSEESYGDWLWGEPQVYDWERRGL